MVAKRREASERAGALSLERCELSEPTLSRRAEGHAASANEVGSAASVRPGSKNSARSQTLTAREPGELGGASLSDRHPREGPIRTPRSRASEMSDPSIVPKKPANSRVTPEESVEGRDGAKGKSTRGNARQTQGWESVTTQLKWIGQVAKKKKGERFNNLMHLIKEPLLKAAFERLKRNAAPGVDDITWEEYGRDLDARLSRLRDRLHRGSYQPLPVRRVHIPKGDGRTRPLGIPALEDKIVQQAVRMVLEPIYEQQFMGFSYGFRPGRSQHRALDALSVALHRMVNWVLDADLRSFFDSVDHDWMKKFVEHRIGDCRLVRLLMKWLKAGVMEDGRVKPTELGTPQGGIISPLLANIYLHYALDVWVHQWRRLHARGDVYIVRYADDFVMGFQWERDALEMRTALAERLRRFGLTLHPDKTRLIRFGRFAWRDSRQSGGKPGTFDFLGFTHICAENERGGFWVWRRTMRKRRVAKVRAVGDELRRRRHEPLATTHAWLLSVLRGHYAYFGVPGNERALITFRRAIVTQWHRQLSRRGQRGKLVGKRRESFERRFPLPSPTRTHPWPHQRFTSP